MNAVTLHLSVRSCETRSEDCLAKPVSLQTLSKTSDYSCFSWCFVVAHYVVLDNQWLSFPTRTGTLGESQLHHLPPSLCLDKPYEPSVSPSVKWSCFQPHMLAVRLHQTPSTGLCHSRCQLSWSNNHLLLNLAHRVLEEGRGSKTWLEWDWGPQNGQIEWL